jgi:capsid protein
MKRTLLDRALGYIGLQKRNNSVFSGAQTTRLTLDWVATILSANQELRGNLRLLRSRGRELSRNNPVAKNYLNLLAANVIGPKGIGYQPQVRNNDGKLSTQINEKIEEAWIDWGKRGSTGCSLGGSSRISRSATSRPMAKFSSATFPASITSIGTRSS